MTVMLRHHQIAVKFIFRHTSKREKGGRYVSKVRPPEGIPSSRSLCNGGCAQRHCHRRNCRRRRGRPAKPQAAVAWQPPFTARARNRAVITRGFIHHGDLHHRTGAVSGSAVMTAIDRRAMPPGRVSLFPADVFGSPDIPPITGPRASDVPAGPPDRARRRPARSG